MARSGRPTVEIIFTGNERPTLERWARRLTHRLNPLLCTVASCSHVAKDVQIVR